ncbi:hypothetical protein BGP75_22115 [Motiliproteus sp. MSK22-1]|nr:hypothetical protein BGP75_22115 [Motiliproteus sp. MSK22-1]
MDFWIFDYHFNNALLTVMGIFCFFGLTFGWFFRKGLSIWRGVIALFVFAPILGFLVAINFWPLSLAFLAGFLIHAAKPIYYQATGRG